MKILAHSRDPRGNELITYQFELPTYLLPELLKFKTMEITWNETPSQFDYMSKSTIGMSILITLTTTKITLMEFFEKVCPRYELESGTVISNNLNNIYFKTYKQLIHFVKCNSNNKDTINTIENGRNKEYNQNKSTNIQLQQIAEQMYDKYYYSKAIELKEGDWHIPYNNNNNLFINYEMEHLNELSSKERIKMELRLATALISNPQETDYYKLLEIYDQLLENNELDTFVHCARVMNDEEYENSIKSDYRKYSDIKNGWCESYKGFISYKNIIDNETNYN